MYKSVKDVKEGQLVSLAQALAQDIIVTDNSSHTITHSNGEDFNEVKWAKFKDTKTLVVSL